MANFIGFVVMAMAYALPMSFMQTIFSKISYILELPGMVIANALFNGVIEITFLKYVSVAVVNTVFYILVYYVVTFSAQKVTGKRKRFGFKFIYTLFSRRFLFLCMVLNRRCAQIRWIILGLLGEL
ncbi:hypothetical protein HC823_00800 [Candidatus Gracilibacteria bacterium]|nr:hypothetical protein [Candidatus Gracilibacteria bacterium]